jgi:hypothetical protein
LLTDEDIRLFQANSELRNRLRKSFVRFLRFAGLELNEEDRVVEGVNFDKRCPEVWKYENHNWLRVSRVLASLHLLGLKGESKAFLAWLEGAYRAGTGARREAASSLEHWAKHTRD